MNNPKQLTLQGFSEPELSQPIIDKIKTNCINEYNKYEQARAGKSCDNSGNNRYLTPIVSELLHEKL